jgi:hypothetical protein
MSEHFISVRDEFRLARDRDDVLKRELGAVDTYHELDEIQLVHRYDEIHELEQRSLLDEQRQLVAFISNALLDRIEHKISPSFRRQLEQEAQQTNQPEEVV